MTPSCRRSSVRLIWGGLAFLFLTIGVQAAFQDSFENEELFARRLIERRLYDYAKDQLKYLRLNFRQQGTAIDILEAQLLVVTSQRQKAIELLNKVPKDSPDYPKALLVKIRFQPDVASRIATYKDYFKNVPKPTSKAGVSDYRNEVFIYSDLLLQSGDPKAAKASLDLLKGLPGEDQSTQRRIKLMSGQIMLAGAEQLRQEGKPVKEVNALVQQGLNDLLELIWIPDYWSAMAYPDICHAYNLLEQPDKSLSMFEQAYSLMKTTEEDIVKQSGSVQGTPLAPAIYYLGESYMEKARQIREQEKKEKDADAKKKLQADTGKVLVTAAKYFYKVYQDYGDLPRAKDALAQIDTISKILDKYYGIKINFGGKQAVDVAMKTAKEQFTEQNYARAADSYLEAIRLNPNGTHVLEAASRCTICYYQLGKFWEAMALNDLLIDKYPDTKEAGESTYNLGVSMLRESKRLEGSDPKESERMKDLGLDYLQKFVEIAPTHPFAAETAYRIAENQYARATQLRKDAKELETKGAKVEEINEKISAAKAAYRKAIPMYQSVVENHAASANALLAYRKMGWIYQILEDREDAARNFLAYADRVEDKPEDKVEAKYLAADNLLRASDADGAMEQLNQLITWTDKGGIIPPGPKAKKYRALSQDLLPWAFDLKARLLQDKVTEQKDLLKDLEQKAETPPEKKEPVDVGESGVAPVDSSLSVDDVKNRIADLEKETKTYQEKAVEGFSQVIARNPKSDSAPELMRRIGSIYGQQGDFAKAAEWLERLDKEYPETEAGQQALFTLFRSYITIGQADKAKGVTQRMIGRLKDYGLPNVMFIATRLFERDDRLNETVLDADLALAANREIIRRSEDPKNPDRKNLEGAKQRALFLEAKCLYLMKKYQDALDKANAFVETYDTSPYFFDAKVLIGKCYRELGKMGEALDEFNDILRVINKDEYTESYYEAVLESARTLNQSSQIGRVKEAAARLRLVTDFAGEDETPELQPFVEACYYEMVKTLSYLGDTEKAQEYQKRYLEKFLKGTYRRDILALPAKKF